MISVCTNACWAIGEIAVTSQSSEVHREALSPHLSEIFQRVAALLSQQKLNRTLAQNLACAMGRLVLVSPHLLSDATMQGIMKQWCLSLRMLKDPNEKESAYRGFCSVLPVSVKAVTENFPFLCSCFSNYKQPPADLEQ